MVIYNVSCDSQVTGELSTGGRPMRAFVQTFVLAPESPKKYYVHNDIFRYQDEDLSESETNETPGEKLPYQHLIQRRRGTNGVYKLSLSMGVP